MTISAKNVTISFVIFIAAGVVKLADTLDLGSSARACRFESCRLHQIRKTLHVVSWRVFFVVIPRGSSFDVFCLVCTIIMVYFVVYTR